MIVAELLRRIFSLINELPMKGIVNLNRGEPIARMMPLKRAKKGQHVSEAILTGKSKPGPLCPKDENPYGLLFD